MQDLYGKKVLVTGVNGCIGSAAAALLAEKGFSVVGFDIQPLRKNLERFCTDNILGDITDSRQIETAVGACDFVVHLAGWVHAVPKNEKEIRKVFEINHEATGNLASICKIKEKRLVFASTVAVYGDEVSGTLDETTPTNPTSAYGQAKLLAERAVIEAGGVTLRLPLVYGAYDRGNMTRMIRSIRQGWFVIPSNGAAAKTFAGRWNVASAIYCALAAPRAAGEVFLVTDEETTTLKELGDLIAEIYGCRKPLSLPSPLLTGVAAISSGIETATGLHLPLSFASYRKLTRNLIFDGRKIRSELGYSPLRSLKEGLEEQIEWIGR